LRGSIHHLLGKRDWQHQPERHNLLSFGPISVI
jgi:hypothetical protein